MRALGIVPARGGSKGLPGKNLRELAGLPLVVHAVRALELVDGIHRVIVSTDDPRIAEVAREHGADVPFLRPPELARDETPMVPVLQHALAWVEESEDSAYDAVMLCDPTSPARQPDKMRAGLLRLAEDPGIDGVVAVSEPMFHPSYVGVSLDAAGVMSRYYPDGRGVTRRQDSGGRFLRINGSFYAWRSDFLRGLGPSWIDHGVQVGLEVDELHAFSIDTEAEWRVVEAIVKTGVVPLPWLEESGAGT